MSAMDKQERIGIFGCTADPFTLAHREIVKQVLEQKLVDNVIIVPTVVDYHRGDKRPWLSSKEKLDIIKALKEGIHPVFVDGSELSRKDLVQLSPELEDHAVKSWRFIDTLLRIKIKYLNSVSKDVEKLFYPIIGGDSLESFTTWFAWKDILKQSAGIIAIERNGKPINPKKIIAENPEFDGKLITVKINDEFAEISASKTREMWKKYTPAGYLEWAIATINTNKTTKENRTLLHTPIFDVIKGEKTETGLEPVLVKAPDWVSIVVKRGDEVLIEKQFRYGGKCEVEEFPCGMIENNESPHEAVLRELEEETGICVEMDSLKYLGATNPNPAFMTNRMHYFYLDLDKCRCEQRERKLDSHERIELHWEKLEDFSCRIFKLAKYQSSKVPAILLSMLGLLKNASETGKI